jgi:thymidylate synthase (FAD)
MTEATLNQFLALRISGGHESIIEHFVFTVRFIIDRGVSHELVRHRLAAFSQESTRYCSYNKDKFGNQVTFILPNWLQDIEPGEYTSLDLRQYSEPSAAWLLTMFSIESRYMEMINNFKWTAQQARSILPNSLKTEIVVTANLREWRHIFKMRTAMDAHPQMREVMVPLLEELKIKIPVVFDSFVVGE